MVQHGTKEKKGIMDFRLKFNLSCSNCLFFMSYLAYSDGDRQ